MAKADLSLAPEKSDNTYLARSGFGAGSGIRKHPAEVALVPVVIEAPSSPGLVHSYLIDADDDRRIAVHKLLSGSANMIVRAYRNRASFLASAEAMDEGCIILFEDGDGADLAPFIRDVRGSQRFACILLTGEHNILTAIEAMKAGAVDCLLYPCEPEAILASVGEALALVRQMMEETAGQAEARDAIDRLTAREKDVLHGLLHGKSNKLIALDLHISPRTVEIYRAHLMEKLGTHSLSETLKIAFAAGLN